MKFRYFYGSSADQYSFIRIPKLLITDNQFSELTIQAKMLYGLLLDRMAMSIKNKWVDNQNRVYVIYPIAEIQNDIWNVDRGLSGQQYVYHYNGRL